MVLAGNARVDRRRVRLSRADGVHRCRVRNLGDRRLGDIHVRRDGRVLGDGHGHFLGHVHGLDRRRRDRLLFLHDRVLRRHVRHLRRDCRRLMRHDCSGRRLEGGLGDLCRERHVHVYNLGDEHRRTFGRRRWIVVVVWSGCYNAAYSLLAFFWLHPSAKLHNQPGGKKRRSNGLDIEDHGQI